MLPIVVVSLVLGLVSAQCGQKPAADSFIIGGEEATPNEWPWQLSLEYFGSHSCGATLVDAEWVITAAHCVELASPNNLLVVAGEHSFSTDSGLEQYLDVDSIYIHPDYFWPDYDVAVLHLSSPATLNEYVDIACTPKLDEDYSDSTCWISGWGLLHGDDWDLPDDLQEVEIDVLTTTECRDYWGFTIDDGVVCVYDTNGGSNGETGGCNGDSGGPISCLRNGSWDVIGAASFVYVGCNTAYPTGYARLTYMWDFIQDITGLEPGV